MQQPTINQGTLIETDIATKIHLTEFNKKHAFIIEDIDDRHLFIYDSYLERV